MMNISLDSETEKLLKRQMKRGRYERPQDVILAGLATLEQQDQLGDFAPSELDGLLAVADAEIARGDVVDGAKALLQRRRRRGGWAKRAG